MYCVVLDRKVLQTKVGAFLYRGYTTDISEMSNFKDFKDVSKTLRQGIKCQGYMTCIFFLPGNEFFDILKVLIEQRSGNVGRLN